jgi:hypothetical protein
MQIQRVPSDALSENKLPDGSRLIVNQRTETVFALNATAGAAWDACAEPTTLTALRERMKLAVGSEVTEEEAEQAVFALQERNLVTSSQAPLRTRRQMLATIGAVALPMVVALTLADQKAFAKSAQSTSSAPPPPPPNCNLLCQILRGLGL